MKWGKFISACKVARIRSSVISRWRRRRENSETAALIAATAQGERAVQLRRAVFRSWRSLISKQLKAAEISSQIYTRLKTSTFLALKENSDRQQAKRRVVNLERKIAGKFSMKHALSTWIRKSAFSVAVASLDAKRFFFAVSDAWLFFKFKINESRIEEERTA